MLRKTRFSESLFNKTAGLQPTTLLNRDCRKSVSLQGFSDNAINLILKVKYTKSFHFFFTASVIQEYGFPLIRIFPDKDTIENSVFVWENAVQIKLIFGILYTVLSL